MRRRAFAPSFPPIPAPRVVTPASPPSLPASLTGGPSLPTHPSLRAETLRANGTSKRALADAMSSARAGRLSDPRLPPPAPPARHARAHPKRHGVHAPRVGVGSAAPPAPPATRRGIKPAATILRERESEPEERYDGTQTRRGRDNDAEKARLAATMARGSRRASSSGTSTRGAASAASSGPPFSAGSIDGGIDRPVDGDSSGVEATAADRRLDRIARIRAMGPSEMSDAIHAEIDERFEFLRDADAAGEGAAHRGRVLAEIRERVAQLETLDAMIIGGEREEAAEVAVEAAKAARSRSVGAGPGVGGLMTLVGAADVSDGGDGARALGGDAFGTLSGSTARSSLGHASALHPGGRFGASSSSGFLAGASRGTTRGAYKEALARRQSGSGSGGFSERRVL